MFKISGILWDTSTDHFTVSLKKNRAVVRKFRKNKGHECTKNFGDFMGHHY